MILSQMVFENSFKFSKRVLGAGIKVLSFAKYYKNRRQMISTVKLGFYLD